MNYLEKAEAFREEIRQAVKAVIARLDKAGTIAIGADNLWQLVNLHACKHGPRGAMAPRLARQEFDSVIEERAFAKFIYQPEPERTRCPGCGIPEKLDEEGLCLDCRRLREEYITARLDPPL